MTQALVVSVVALWIVVLLLAGVVFALARQVGVLHERIAPAGALALSDGPKVGEAAPTVAAEALDGGRLAIGDPSHVPAGIYAKSALEALDAWPALAGKTAPTADVRAALALVHRGEAAAGQSRWSGRGSPSTRVAFRSSPLATWRSRSGTWPVRQRCAGPGVRWPH